MQKAGIALTRPVLLSLLAASGRARDLEVGRVAVDLYRSSGWQAVDLSSAVIDMFGKCGCVEEARAEFDRMPMRNQVTYGVMVAALASVANRGRRLRVVREMQAAGVVVNGHVLASLLTACARARDIEIGRAAVAYRACGQEDGRVVRGHIYVRQMRVRG